MVFAESDTIHVITDSICLNPNIDMIHEEMTYSITIVNSFDQVVIFNLKFSVYFVLSFLYLTCRIKLGPKGLGWFDLLFNVIDRFMLLMSQWMKTYLTGQVNRFLWMREPGLSWTPP